ncbi:DUF4173 domain-containing protein [Aureibaculum sp. 2210JD6-5]|uniref:DUF4153 domain-containing protein n=1 Tax=Aureibaculum sp. 2210JD6-5 TaxID=3103957 RepID=UPI002AAC6303|nr:DUF4173 domain-containing protein [Aureibaculum sp. 2210JD6-5]MDY7394724.1 DUF4173 domain-containing protein [Aureibaculum sp. 2210JD6-5]
MNKNISLLVGSFFFSLLFFKQNLGLNFLLFSMLTVGLLGVFNAKKFISIRVIVAVLSFLIMAGFVFIYNSTLSVLSSIIAFFYLLGTLSEEKSSVYIQILNGFFSSIAAGFTIYYNRLIDETKAVKKKNINYIYWFKMVGIPIIVLLVFVILYRSANPYFNELFKSIDFSFINLQWVLFTVLGYFLLLNITSPLSIEPITEYDLKTLNTLNKEGIKPQPLEDLEQENQLGIILLVLLNLLILFFLITDTVYLSRLTDLNAPDLSKTVHEGIYALITSIFFAIGIILYFFRGNLNFYEKNNNLKTLTTLWIALNIFLIFITVYKNYIYVSFHGLTYKRIGVFVYLLLALIGLITTFIKVYSTLNFWFLCRKNISIGLLLLLISTTVNWDQLITKYNTEYANNTDFDYLISLSDNNTFMLKEFKDTTPNKPPLTAQNKIENKYSQYHRRLENKKWQELVFDNLKLEK